MRYKGKQIAAQTINFGGGEYGLWIKFTFPEGEEVPAFYKHWGYLIMPLSATVTTKDLKEGWFFRLFSRRLHVTHLTVQERSRYDISGKECSFNSMPKVWQDLFEPILDSLKDGWWNEFDIEFLNDKRRDEAYQKESA